MLDGPTLRITRVAPFVPVLVGCFSQVVAHLGSKPVGVEACRACLFGEAPNVGVDQAHEVSPMTRATACANADHWRVPPPTGLLPARRRRGTRPRLPPTPRPG